MRDTTGTFDGTNSYHTYYNTAWQNFTSVDLYMTLTLTDTTPPTLSITSPANQTSSFSNTTSVSGTSSDNVAVSSVTWKVDSGSVSTATGTTSWSFTTNVMSVGTHNIYVNATDVVGLVTQKLLQVTVESTTDRFGVQKLYPTISGGTTWTENWDNGHSRVVSLANSSDSYDSWVHGTGFSYPSSSSGNITIDGNGVAKLMAR